MFLLLYFHFRNYYVERHFWEVFLCIPINCFLIVTTFYNKSPTSQPIVSIKLFNLLHFQKLIFLSPNINLTSFLYFSVLNGELVYEFINIISQIRSGCKMLKACGVLSCSSFPCTSKLIFYSTSFSIFSRQFYRSNVNISLFIYFSFLTNEL